MFRNWLRIFRVRALTLVASVSLPVVLAATGCGSPSSTADVAATELAIGTWGGEAAGLIVDDSLVHVHIGCTNGDFVRPRILDAEGRFDIKGSYVIRAYPIQTGPSLPARFTGVARGNRITMTVAVDDTVERKSVTLGPAVMTLGRNPKLAPCPICLKADRK